MTSKKLIVLALSVLFVSCGQGGAGEADQANIAAAATKEFMAETVDPQAQIVWRAAGSYSDASGDHDYRPTIDEGWQAAVGAAAALAETGRQLAGSPYADGRGEDWVTFAEGLVAISEKNRKALADRASDDELLVLGGEIYNVCSACHEAYPAMAVSEPE